MDGLDRWRILRLHVEDNIPLTALARETGTALHVTADEASHRAFGTNPLDPARRIPSFEAGLAQARQLADRVTEFWNA